MARVLIGIPSRSNSSFSENRKVVASDEKSARFSIPLIDCFIPLKPAMKLFLTIRHSTKSFSVSEQDHLWFSQKQVWIEFPKSEVICVDEFVGKDLPREKQPHSDDKMHRSSSGEK